MMFKKLIELIIFIVVLLFFISLPYFIIKGIWWAYKSIPNCDTYYEYVDLDGNKGTSTQCKGYYGTLYCGDDNRAVMVKEIEKIEVCK